jgi:hypothetical protein
MTTKMTPEEFTNKFNLDYTDGIRSYNGKSGCMCGCIGTYKETESAIKRMYNKLMKLPKIGVHVKKNGVILCIFDDDGNRNSVLYFNE